MVKSYDSKPTSNPTAAPDQRISVVKLTKSGGCVDRDQSFMKSLRESQIRSYFFGNPIPSIASSALSLSSTSSSTNVTLSPHAQQLDFDSLSIYNIVLAGDGEDDDDDYDPSKLLGANDSFLPGDSGEQDTTPHPLQQLQQQLQLQPQQQPDVSTSSHYPAPPFKKLTGPPSMALENSLLAITHAATNASPAEIRDASIMGFLYVVDVDDKKGKIRVLAPVGGRVPARAIMWGRKWPGEVIGLVA
jgi:polyribonucleotide 5'-hydroxyl-kinase